MQEYSKAIIIPVLKLIHCVMFYCTLILIMIYIFVTENQNENRGRLLKEIEHRHLRIQ